MRPPNTQWITDQAWDNVCELEKQIEHYQGLSSSIQLNPADWKRWFSSTLPDPEKAQLPGEWETKCEDVHDLKKMVILRCFRPDRVRFAIENFINAYHKNTEFTTSKAATLTEAYEDSNPETPIIFLMAPGVDPTEQLKRFAQEQDISIVGISLGKGQEERAKTIVKDCAQKGKWCFLSNCHLSVNLLPELENIMDEVLEVKENYDEKFRIFMSAAPIPKEQEGDKFPISFL
jgi:dynein heavy chain, axonemal